MTWFYITCSEVHNVVYEVEAINADEAQAKIEEHDWETVFVQMDEIVDREVEGVMERPEEEEA